MIGRLARLGLLILVAPLMYSFLRQAYLFVQAEITFERIVWFVVGMVCYLLVYAIFFHGNPDYEFVETFSHELAHATVSVVLFQMPTSFIVDLKNRKAEVVTRSRSPFTVLAPYYLPLLTIPFLIVKPIVIPEFHGVIDFLIGFTLCFYYVVFLKDFRLKQTDITKTGIIFSFVFTLFLNALFLVIILCVVIYCYVCILDYFKASLVGAVDAYKAAWQWVLTELLPKVRLVLEQILERVRGD
jgi:hypothetical protein